MDAQKTHFCYTLSQSSIHVSESKHDNTNLSLSHGNKPTFRSIERSVIPLNILEEHKFLLISPNSTHKHLNQDRVMPVFKQFHM